MFAIWSDGRLEENVAPEEALRVIEKDLGTVWIDLEPSEETSLWVRTHFHFDELSVHSWEEADCRARAENHDDYVYSLLYRVGYSPDEGVVAGHYHCYLGRNYLVTVHRGPDGAVQEAMHSATPHRICTMGPDMLFYLLGNSLVDSSFPVLDTISDEVEGIEERMYDGPDGEIPRRLYELKRHLLDLRRHASPMREAFGFLARKENQVIDIDVLPYVWELYDRTVRISEMVDVNREIVSGALEMYMTIVSNRMNEKMTTLTIVSVIFLPLTVIVGYYGMNFRFFPELGWKLGLVFVWGLMIAVVLGMLWLFSRRKWM